MIINTEFNYSSMVALIYSDPLINLRVWEELCQINNGRGLCWSPEDYILIPFPIFHNYYKVIRELEPDQIMEYDLGLKMYSFITEDPDVMKILVDFNLISAFIGVDNDYLVFTDNKYPVTFNTKIYKTLIRGGSMKRPSYPIKCEDLSIDLQGDFIRRFIRRW